VLPHMDHRNASNACFFDAKNGEIYLDHLDCCHGKSQVH
jgi:hypothetical protein